VQDDGCSKDPNQRRFCKSCLSIPPIHWVTYLCYGAVADDLGVLKDNLEFDSSSRKVSVCVCVCMRKRERERDGGVGA
jgi:hypothetical protein